MKKTLTDTLKIAALFVVLGIFCCGLMLPVWADKGDRDRGDRGKRAGDSSRHFEGFGDDDAPREKKPRPQPTPKPGPREGGADD